MGKEMMKISAAFVGLQAIFLFLGAFILPLHRAALTAATGIVMTIDTYSNHVVITPTPSCQKAFSAFPTLSKYANKYCPGSRSYSMTDWSSTVCDGTLTFVIGKKACTGAASGKTLGAFVWIVTGLSFLMEAIAGYLMYLYLGGTDGQYKNKGKKQFRDISLGLLVTGPGILVIILGAYIPMVMSNLDGLVLPPSRGTGSGVTWGYFVLWLAILFQVAGVVLLQLNKSKDEESYAERREIAKAELEMSSSVSSANMANGSPAHGAGLGMPPANPYDQSFQYGPGGPPQMGMGMGPPPMGGPPMPPQMGPPGQPAQQTPYW